MPHYRMAHHMHIAGPAWQQATLYLFFTSVLYDALLFLTPSISY